MAESRGLKFYLDWAQHGYWIGNALLSLGLGRGLMTTVGKYIHIAADWRGVVWLIFSGLLFWLFAFIRAWWQKRKYNPIQQESSELQSVARAAIGGNTAALNIEKALAESYNSALQSEVETNFRNAIFTYPETERQPVAIKLLAAGLISYMYDKTWWSIYKSQILLLQDLNTKTLRIEKVKEYYDRAVEQYPAAYARYSFNQWVAYMKEQALILDQPAESVGITVRGRDFLKYIVHSSYSIDGKTL